MKTIGIMTLLSVLATAAAPGRETGRGDALAAVSISQPPAGCREKANDGRCFAVTGDVATDQGAR